MTRQLQPCGTTAAYLRHWRRGEEPCDACKEVHYAANRARRRIVRAQGADLPPCTNCGGPRKPYTGVASKGWCDACRCRWERAGRPEGGPPPPQDPAAASRAVRSAAWVERRAEYYNLRDLMGFTPEQAADDVGISPLTARRWDKRRQAVNA